MQLEQPLVVLFNQLNSILCSINPVAYSKPLDTLFNASIGQHIRHIIELFLELDKGYESGTINYELRKRDYRIETDPEFAILQLQEIIQKINRANKELQLVSDYTLNESGIIVISTNYFREIIYNLEHTVHHMALLKVGLKELSINSLPEGFGIAVSTIKHQQKLCAQ